MSLFRRRPRNTPNEDRAISMLVARHPRDYLTHCIEGIHSIPNGGSIFPWRYRRQCDEALDRAERAFVVTHLTEWCTIVELLDASDEIRTLTPDDFQP